MKIKYFDKKIETLPRQELEELQLKRLKETIDRSLKIEFYKKRLNQIGIKSGHDIKNLKDITKIPFTTKDDLQSSYPKGFLAVPRNKIIRLHTSSDTKGIPTVIYHTKRDIEYWSNLTARCMIAAGATDKDVFQNMTQYELFTDGLGIHYGAEKIGMTVIPSGPTNTRRQLILMKNFKTTIVHTTPSYLLHIYEKMEEYGFKLKDFTLKKAFLGTEQYSENIKQKIEKLFKIDVYNSYGLSEMNGPGVSFECIYKNGMHTWEDAFLLEIINPKTGTPVEEGKQGEIVFTTLIREATPFLRYRTRDLAYIYNNSCQCKRTHKKISRIVGKTDDMFIINNINIFPSQIETIIMKFPEVGTNYQIWLKKKNTMDEIIIRVEINPKLLKGDNTRLDNLKNKIIEKIRDLISINPIIEFYELGSLSISEGKAIRVIDQREK